MSPAVRSPKPCPICLNTEGAVFLSLELPVNCSTLFRSREEARVAKKGPIALSFCGSCGMIFNVAYDPSLLDYDISYDNSLHFSPAFQSYCSALIRRLTDTYELREKVVVEVGCGNGDFLAQFCEAGNNRGFGFDPAFTGSCKSESVRIYPTLYSPASMELRADAVICRHVLEHIPDPCDFLRSIRGNLANSPKSVFYCEIPNAAAVLTGSSLWDVIYPHCSYFSSVSMRHALVRAGFETLQIRTSFKNQFLAFEARRNDSSLANTLDAPDEITELTRFVKVFAGRFELAMEQWSALIEECALANRQVALWGAGAKAVTFLNMVPGAERIAAVVDSNPRKHGMFIPCTGQRICSPADLADYGVHAVILLNEAYESEVRQALTQLVPNALLWVSAAGFPSTLERPEAA